MAAGVVGHGRTGGVAAGDALIRDVSSTVRGRMTLEMVEGTEGGITTVVKEKRTSEKEDIAGDVVAIVPKEKRTPGKEGTAGDAVVVVTKETRTPGRVAMEEDAEGEGGMEMAIVVLGVVLGGVAEEEVMVG